MRYGIFLAGLCLLVVTESSRAQQAKPAAPVTQAASGPTTNASGPTTNASVVPTPHTVPRAQERTELVLRRAREHAGPCDVVFLGDSITERWETDGADAWRRYYGRREVLNLGVGGDRTQHTLWRLEHGQLDGLRPKVLVLLLGTNNANSCPEGEIVEAVGKVVGEVRRRLPAETKILLMGIFPRGETFNPIRGKVTQVNQALAQLDDGKQLFFVDLGPRFVAADGSIARDVMNDFVHLAPRGYATWAEGIEPHLRRLLGEP